MSELSLEMVRLRGLSFRPMAPMPLWTAPGGGVGVGVSSTPSPESLDDVLRVSWDEQVEEADETVDDDFAGGLRDNDEADVAAVEEAATATESLCWGAGDEDSCGGDASSLLKQARRESMSRSAVSLSTKSSHE